MKSSKLPNALSAFLALALCFGVGLSAQQQLTPPPEYAELQAANRIANLEDRIKELNRVKAAYPESRLTSSINAMILEAATNNADTLDKVLAAQRELIASVKLSDRANLIVGSAALLIGHEKLASFPKEGVLKAIEKYRAEGLELFPHPDLIGQVPEERRAEWLGQVNNLFEIPLAKAQLLNGDGKAALATMEAAGKAQSLGEGYYDVLGDIYIELKRDKDALDAYMKAAVEDKDAADKAKALYAKLNGDAALPKFEAELERLRAQLPFHPPAFVAPADWKDKTVLAELFTGSECPPCVAADLAFDGFIESYPSKYLAILQYHLPIPGPDPMMNPATKKRGDYYGANSTPTIWVDGVAKVAAGGGRPNAFASFNRIKKEVDSALAAKPDITIRAAARLEGDKVTVDAEFSKVIENAEYNVALVQSEEKHKGGNGIVFHKMVVRDFATVKPSEKASATFNIPESEKAADAYLSEYEKEVQARRPTFKWAARRNTIDRSGLKAVVFVQDKETKQVYNAFVADVAKR